MLDAGTVRLDIDATGMRSVAHAIGRIERILVEPELPARVIVDQRSGTIVMGQDVRISRVAVSQGNLTGRVAARYDRYPEVHQSGRGVARRICGQVNGIRLLI